MRARAKHRISCLAEPSELLKEAHALNVAEANLNAVIWLNIIDGI